MAFNEDSRVKIPALLHLVRLGYQYISRKHHDCLPDNNIFPLIFKESISRINPSLTNTELDSLLREINLKLDYDDLGKSFFDALTATSGIKLIDFKNFGNNTFHVTTELTCKNGDDEFRPDITVFINGMPLIFIEVKKPNNHDGVLSERNRINKRYANKRFKRFANITQLMIFSNNMEYEDGVVAPIQGAYYATSAYGDLHFNYFRETETENLKQTLFPENHEDEDFILKDNNIESIKYSPEFQTNKDTLTATHRLLTSLLSKDRIAFILRYAFVYVTENKDGRIEAQKHVMRYPQFFATKAITNKLDEGWRKGIIWHTQGSGKTALAYYNVKHLTDYFQKQGKIAKFYFIVDRIDLAIQAASEFSDRGLRVNSVDSRVEFINDIKKVSAIHNHSGEYEISVINIQKFTEDAVAATNLDYDIQIQRIYFLDEAHRSYNPKGNYLANLINSDRKAILIALTGTPLLKQVVKDYDTKELFGNYIHKYYYNQSIADGYTLRLIREGIDTSYKLQMQEILEKINILQGDLKKKLAYAHPKYVKPLLDYIIDDLKKFRLQDETLGGMVVCDSSEQARALFEAFEDRFGINEVNISNFSMAAEPYLLYKTPEKSLKSALILHDVSDKSIRKDLIASFKAGKIDLLFVYNMLLTGFDAKRLKKLYITRVIKDHNLLQTLTRVNRPYKKFQYGYVVDFADISKAFDKTNQLYFEELQAELGDEMESYSKLFKSEDEIKTDILDIQEVLFHYNTQNAEIFRQQIQEVRDKKVLQSIIKALRDAGELKNIIRLEGYHELLQKLDFFKLGQLLREAEGQLDKLNLIDTIQNEIGTTNLLNAALEDVIFMFTKVSEKELILADELKNHLSRTRESLLHNFDQKDPAFISLKEELERIFKKKNLSEISQDDMRDNIVLLQGIYNQVKELNRKNDLLKAKFEQDEKYVRVHKRLMEKGNLVEKESQLYEALQTIKLHTDKQILRNKQLIENESYFTSYLMNLVVKELKQEKKMNLNFATASTINGLIVNEYLQQYNAY